MTTELNRLETLGDFLVYRTRPDQLRLVWRDDDGDPLGQLEAARRAVEAEGEQVLLVLNAGLYRPDLSPAGLHVEDGVELVPINLNDGPGNFHLTPNGVFSIEDGRASVMESNAYVDAGRRPRLAVQSGPMLTIDGEFHRVFRPGSSSRYVRNGVGVTEDGDVVFIQSTVEVNLWTFAEAFLRVGAPNSLYLDGSIARMAEPPANGPIFPNIPFAAMLVVVAP